MKKILTIILALMMMPAMADAQIKITGKRNVQTLMSIRMGMIDLDYDGKYYLAMRTSNQFDDTMILPLGGDKQVAMQTLQDLIDIATSLKKGDSIKIESAYGREFRIYRLAKNAVGIYADGYAGYASTSKTELTRLLDCVMFDVR